ncbi:ATPase [Pseudomonas aeruginosa]|nr:ATPase [Pseudomonas aeruginosa]MBG6831281.1 ATPase [Pseudomonas aeruginosa]
MRNDAFDELDDVPSLTTDAADRDEFSHHPRHVYEPEQRRVVDTKERRPASTGPLWALLGAMLIALAGVGWWSHQQISLMEQQLVATQESFVRISEEAAGRLDDIRGKVVASESSVTSEREALRLQVKQLQEKLGSQERQQADVSNQFGGQGKRLDQLASDLKAQQESAAQLVAQLDGKLQTLAAEQEKLKALQVELGKTNEQLKALGGDVAALKKQGNPSQTIKGIQDDLLVLRSQLDNRPAQGGNTAEFDAFRTQVMRNINTLQAQVQNLQQQLNTR